MIPKAYPVLRQESSAQRSGFQKQIKKQRDKHAYLQEYAQKKYELLARPVEEMSPREQYVYWKDKGGVVYDIQIYNKKTMWNISNNLGHERISVIAQSYIG